MMAAYRDHPHLHICFEIHERGQQQNIRDATLVPLVFEEEAGETFDQGPRNVRDNLVFSLRTRSDHNYTDIQCPGDDKLSSQR